MIDLFFISYGPIIKPINDKYCWIELKEIDAEKTIEPKLSKLSIIVKNIISV